MKLTLKLIDNLKRLCEGETVAASALKGQWVDDLIADGVLCCRRNGLHASYYVPNRQAFIISLTQYNEALADLDQARKLITGGDRAAAAAATGNSKIVARRAFHGFAVNSYEPIDASLLGKDIAIKPIPGSFIVVSDPASFSIALDVTVVGIENMANFVDIRSQRRFFEENIPGRLLFAARYPQSRDLPAWLATIPNRYVHFGDFDPAGINIFLNEFAPFVGNRGSFLIPKNIDVLLSRGTTTRYLDHRNIKVNTADPALLSLLSLIKRHRRCLDQEAFILGFADDAKKG